MKKYYVKSRIRGISYMKYGNERRNILVRFCVYEKCDQSNAFYNGVIEGKKKRGDKSERKTRKKT